MSYTRFAIYYLPCGELATFGASWLGWDVTRGTKVDRFDIPRLSDVTKRPCKYGFHATLKPPFALRAGATPDDLVTAVSDLASRLRKGRCSGLRPQALGRFLALVPSGDAVEISCIAAACVTELDAFRAPLSEADLARRRASHLSPQQDAYLVRWGYPYVLDAFRFHMTLTDRVPKTDLDHWLSAVSQHLPPLPTPFDLSDLALVGERKDGFFELVQRFNLSG
jgi:hypothetical protein